jgi:hypothetical protein
VGVHVGDVEISIVPTGDAPVTKDAKGAEHKDVPGQHEERWLQSRARLDWLASRTQADDFND